MKIFDTNSFLEAAKKIHGDLYNYSLVDYKYLTHKVIIICDNHEIPKKILQTPQNHLKGQGCRECSVARSANFRRKPKEAFIAQAKKIHQNKYGYDKVEYKGDKKQVFIFCKKCEEYFSQMARKHLSGQGCPECGGKKKLTLEKFIEKAIIVHGTNYEYNKVNYINCQTLITITCKKHGDFFQTPEGHLVGRGCSNCGNERNSLSKLKTLKKFIQQANDFHHNKYDYSISKYLGDKKPIEIICPIHGLITQLPGNHIKHGCSDCAGNKLKTTEEFIKEAVIVHGNKYDYSETIYISAVNELIIKCKKHNDYFTQIPRVHTGTGGAGCPKCVGSISKKETEWLDLLNINNRQSKIKYNDEYFFVDGMEFRQNEKIVYEFHGNYWHGNPVKYRVDKINERSKKSFGELYQKTLYREQKIRESGYKLVVIWEHEFNALKNLYGSDPQLFGEHLRSHAEYQLAHYN